MAKQQPQRKAPTEGTVRRGQGRPKASDGVEGAEQLLLAARHLLLTTHPDQITQAMVAKQAGVDPRLVRYHFGNMDNMLFELAKSVIKEVDKRMREASELGGSPFEKITRRIRVLLHVFIEMPMFWPLVVEKIYLTDDEEAADLRRTFNEESYRRLETILMKGIDENIIRKDVDPRFLYLLLIGACEIYVTGKPISDVLFSRHEQDNLEDSYAGFLADIIVRGLSTAPGE